MVLSTAPASSRRPARPRIYAADKHVSLRMRRARLDEPIGKPRMIMTTGMLAGAAAGAAGTAALNATTYLDMVWRGRGTSGTPEQTVEAIEDKLPVSVPGEGDTRT